MKVLSPTLFAGLYGRLRLHPWIVPEEMEEDAYSLFSSRAELMGWSRSATSPDVGGLWGMNDASFDLAPRDGSTRVAWFQVGVEETQLPRSLFPLHPLLACAGDVLDRVGVLDLDAVQLMVPLQAAGAPGVMSVPNWFTMCDPGVRAAVRITLDGGEDLVLAQVADDVSELVSRLAREPFAVEPHPAATAHVQPHPELTDGFWMGEGRHPVTFGATTPDWTLDSIAWIANLFVEACRRVGVRTSVLISVGRP